MNTANKILIALVALLLIAIVGSLAYLSTTGKLSFFAEEIKVNKVEISADKTTLKAGDTFILTISGEPDQGTFSGLYTILKWDKGALTLVKAENASFYVGTVKTEFLDDKEEAFIKAVNISRPHPTTRKDATKVTFIANKSTSIEQVNPKLLDTDNYTIKSGPVSSNKLTINVSGQPTISEITFKLDKNQIKKDESVALSVGLNPVTGAAVSYFLNIKWVPGDAVDLVAIESLAEGVTFNAYKNEFDKDFVRLPEGISELNSQKNFWLQAAAPFAKNVSMPMDLVKLTFKAIKDDVTVTVTGTKARVVNEALEKRDVPEIAVSFSVRAAEAGKLLGDFAHYDAEGDRVPDACMDPQPGYDLGGPDFKLNNNQPIVAVNGADLSYFRDCLLGKTLK